MQRKVFIFRQPQKSGRPSPQQFSSSPSMEAVSYIRPETVKKIVNWEMKFVFSFQKIKAINICFIWAPTPKVYVKKRDEKTFYNFDFVMDRNKN